MFSAASGESLKDIKDRLNIRKRGPNSRTVNKEKKVVVGAASGQLKDRTTAVTTQAVGGSSGSEAARQIAASVRSSSA
jgi:predicted RNase H-related nuclease YkuK (DUF458 family)